MLIKKPKYWLKICCGIILLLFGIFLLIYSAQPDFLRKGLKPIQRTTLLNFDITTSSDLASDAAPRSEYRIVIPKIGVDMPIIYNEANEKRALAEGAWLIPGSATPWLNDRYNNAVISAHRFLNTSGPNTFFYLDKLLVGDKILIKSQSSEIVYEVKFSKIVSPDTVSVLLPSKTPRLTLLTCNPVFSTKERLVVVAEKK